MIYTFEQIASIIKKNPAKVRIEKGCKTADKLMLHIHGVGMDKAMKQCSYLEMDDVFSVRKEYAISNKDLFGRLLQQEDMVYTAKGGSSLFNLPEEKEKKLSALLDNIRDGMSLRKWIHDFALQAFRCDPMGVIFIEIEKANGKDQPRAYPTYKSIYNIYDYNTKGRSLEHISFHLTAGEAIGFGVKDPNLKEYADDKKCEYYRFVDDARDLIVRWDGGEVTEVEGMSIPNPWGRTPGFINSNLMRFDDPKYFYSPVHLTVELADCFLYNRSVRDLQQKMHGFAKAIEPILDCPKCKGEGFVEGSKCVTCDGTGIKLNTKVSDVARFPLDALKEGFDFKRIFGYVTPDVLGWEKQDSSLRDLEDDIEQTYWGTVTPRQTSGPTKGGNLDETATKTISDLQPRYARLNQTADWSEKTESLIIDYIGEYEFKEFKKSQIAYGRYYVLESPDDLWSLYQEMRTKGAPEATLYETMEKYYHSLYQNSPMELATRLKLLYVEPFPHLAMSVVKTVATDELDINCKLYFGEWYSTLADIVIISTKTDALREMLKAFVKAKNIPPAPAPVTTGFGK